MDVSVSNAKAQLTELVHRAEKGEIIRLTRHGVVVAHIAPAVSVVDRETRRQRLLDLSARMAATKSAGPDAAHASDFLFDENGMPA